MMAQHSGASYEDENADDAYFYGIKIESRIGSVGVETMYTEVTDDGDYPGVYGHRPSQLYTQTILHALVNKGVKAYSVGASYLVKDGLFKGLKIRAVAQTYEDEEAKGTSRSLDDAKEVMMILGYNFSGDLDGLSTALVADYANMMILIPARMMIVCMFAIILISNFKKRQS